MKTLYVPFVALSQQGKQIVYDSLGTYLPAPLAAAARRVARDCISVVDLRKIDKVTCLYGKYGFH